MLKYAELSIQCASDSQAQSLKDMIFDYCSNADHAGFSTISSDKEWLFIRHDASSDYPATRLALFVSGNNQLVLANIVPEDQSDRGLDKRQYNSILDSFYRAVIVPVCGTRYTIIKPDPNVQIETLIPESYQQLVFWERGVNRRSPFSHPLDLNRWFSFVYSIASHREELSTGDFQLWLQENRGWSNHDAFDAALRYENDRMLANYIISKLI